MKTDETPEDISALAREYGQAALQVLADIMNDKAVAASTRVSAAKAILERGFGKPAANAKERPRAAPIRRFERASADPKGAENPRARRYSQSPTGSPAKTGLPNRPKRRSMADHRGILTGAGFARQSVHAHCGDRSIRSGQALPALPRRPAVLLSRGF